MMGAYRSVSQVKGHSEDNLFTYSERVKIEFTFKLERDQKKGFNRILHIYIQHEFRSSC